MLTSLSLWIWTGWNTRYVFITHYGSVLSENPRIWIICVFLISKWHLPSKLTLTMIFWWCYSPWTIIFSSYWHFLLFRNFFVWPTEFGEFCTIYQFSWVIQILNVVSAEDWIEILCYKESLRPSSLLVGRTNQFSGWGLLILCRIFDWPPQAMLQPLPAFDVQDTTTEPFQQCLP